MPLAAQSVVWSSSRWCNGGAAGGAGAGAGAGAALLAGRCGCCRRYSRMTVAIADAVVAAVVVVVPR